MSQTTTTGTMGQQLDASHLSHQVFLLEDTVMTMSMAVTTISRALARWERVILPMMLGFILLAAYGFYLIFNLVYDIGMISNNVAQMTMTLDKHMVVISDELKDMKRDVHQMSQSVKGMNNEVAQMNQNIQQLNSHVGHIDYSAEKMSNDLWEMSRNISGPMSTMNNIMPWQMMGGKADASPPKRYYRQQAQPQMQYFNPQVYVPQQQPIPQVQSQAPSHGIVAPVQPPAVKIEH